MICPRCKTEVSKDDIICPTCKLKLIFKCPRCNSLTRLGSVSCKKCGYTFVKFCPKCHSANYATSSECRKCHYEFKNENITPKEENDSLKNAFIQANNIENSIPKGIIHIEEKKVTHAKVENQETSKENPDELLFYIDFINLEQILKKYNRIEFEREVIQNIKTTIKIAFNIPSDFINSHVAMMKIKYSKNLKILDKIKVFEEEFNKFNEILERKLDSGLSYKFAISTIEEAKKNTIVPQLNLGSDKDVIISSGTYTKLNNELSLIKISQDSYKMILLEQKPVFEQTEKVNYDKALQLIYANLVDDNSTVRAISINAPRGGGKTHLLNDIYYKISKKRQQNSLYFYAQCSALTQVSPYGLIQNFFISLFNCETVLKDGFNMASFEQRVLNKLELEKLDEDKLETLANLIYPTKKDYFENILINKEITYKCLKEIFIYLKKKKNITFIIDDFDLIDESSYGFLKYLVEENYFEKNAKLILGYKNQHSIAIYFQTNKLNNKNCLNISLRSLNTSESRLFIKKILGENMEVPNEILSHIAYNAQGNIAYIEQILQYLFERKILTINDNVVKFKMEYEDIQLPSTLENCFYERLDFLKEHNKLEYSFLSVASLLGDKLNYKLLAQVFKLSEEDFYKITNLLEKKGYLKQKVDRIYGFKNSLTWSYCYIRAKEEEIIKRQAKELLLELNNKVTSTPLICPILAQIVNNKELAFTLWTQSLQYASYIGDINIYSMAQKQSLILLENAHIDNLEYAKNNICERLGKLTYNKNPQEAKEYLANAVASAQKNNDVNKVIELSGYLVKSAYLTQDYTAVVEVVDNVLNYFYIKDKSEKKSEVALEIALIKAKKLEALLHLGSWEEITSIVNSEINPILQRHLNFFSKHKWISQNEIFYTWVESNIILAQSYAQQGSILSFELISEIDKVLQKEHGEKIDMLKLKLEFTDAIASTSKGYFDDSDEILQDIIKNYAYVIDNPKMVCSWNIISIINKILRYDTENIREDLFEATTYANNCNDEDSKNFLKTLLAYVLLQEKSYLKAIEIATEQMQYFSTKKIALGALLAWYISACATAQNKADMYCIEICEKAVKICENARNNNFYFKVLFQSLLAKAYLKLNDIDNAQMYCDLALQSASANELIYLQVKLNALKADISREKLSEVSDDKKVEHAKNTIKMYNKTIELAKNLNLIKYSSKIEKELKSFKAHCQLNRIIEDIR